MVQKSNRKGERRGSKAAGEREVFILPPEAEEKQAGPKHLAAVETRRHPKATWRTWLRSHWPAVAIGGVVVTGALATWMVYRRREQRQPFAKVRGFLNQG